MSRQISRKEFFEQFAEIMGLDYDEAKLKWAELVDWWVLEVQQYGGLQFPTIGKFTTRYKPEHERYIPNYEKKYDDNAESMVLKTIPEKLRIYFSVSDDFKKAVNGDDLTYIYKIKLKQEEQAYKQSLIEKEKQEQRDNKAAEVLEQLKNKKKDKKGQKRNEDY